MNALLPERHLCANFAIIYYYQVVYYKQSFFFFPQDFNTSSFHIQINKVKPTSFPMRINPLLFLQLQDLVRGTRCLSASCL